LSPSRIQAPGRKEVHLWFFSYPCGLEQGLQVLLSNEHEQVFLCWLESDGSSALLNFTSSCWEISAIILQTSPVYDMYNPVSACWMNE
jgi:hypothetical protein